MLGYTKPLYILPFDHRASLAKSLFGKRMDELTNSEKDLVRNYKKVIYEGFKIAVSGVISKDEAAILVEEQFGSEVLEDARRNGINIILTIEKSGQEEFEFEYGDDFASHIEKYDPDFVKALVHYSSGQEKAKEKLKILSDFCQGSKYKFLIELLTSGDGEDERLENILSAIDEYRKAGIEADVWKLEGLEKEDSFRQIVEVARQDGRENVGIVVLGRGENRGKVEKWITAGAPVTGVIGFAVGRTVFLSSLLKLHSEEISEEEAAVEIAKNFEYFYNLFKNNRI